MWSAAAFAIVALFLLLRQTFIAVFIAWNRWQFSARPELENWIVPSYGVDGPATLWAFIATTLAAATAVFMLAIRQRNSD